MRLEHLAKQLLKRGDNITVIEIAGKGSPYSFAAHEINDTLNWICLFPEAKIEDINPAFAKKEVLSKLDELNPDVVMSGSIAFTSGAAAVDWAKRNNRGVVIFDDSKKEDVQRNFLVNTVKKILYANVDAIFCPAPDWIETFKYWGFKEKAIFFGVDVVDNSFWSKTASQKFDISAPYFLTVGRHIKRKNFHLLIDAFVLFKRESGNNARLVLVGDGVETDHLKKRVPEDLQDDILFLPLQDQNTLVSLYHNAYFFILPSISEQWGLVVNEAMACGLPVIVSENAGCVQSLVEENKNGYWFNPCDLHSLASTLEKASALSESEIKEMKNNSLEIISHWDLDRFTTGAIGAVDYAVKNKRRPFYFIGKWILEKWSGRYNPG